MDAKTFYTANLEVYLGPFRLSNQVPDVVKCMVSPISGSSRNVSMDNWFSSFPLIEDLLSNHRLTVVGNVRKNKKEVPPKLIQIKSRPVLSSMFAFQQNMTLVSYMPKKRKK